MFVYPLVTGGICRFFQELPIIIFTVRVIVYTFSQHEFPIPACNQIIVFENKLYE